MGSVNIRAEKFDARVFHACSDDNGFCNKERLDEKVCHCYTTNRYQSKKVHGKKLCK